MLSADDPRDQEELTAVFRQVKAGALSFDFQTLRNVHDFTLTVRHARRIGQARSWPSCSSFSRSLLPSAGLFD